MKNKSTKSTRNNLLKKIDKIKSKIEVLHKKIDKTQNKIYSLIDEKGKLTDELSVLEFGSKPHPIDELRISNRTYNILNNNNIKYIEELKNISEYDILKWRYCGIYALAELKEICHNIGFDIGDGIKLAKLKELDIKNITNSNTKLDSIYDLDIQTRAYHLLKTAGVVYLQELKYISENDLLKYKHCGRKTLEYLREVCKDFGFKIGEDIK